MQEFFDSLSERPVREEKQLVCDTTDEEVAYITNRAEEAALAAAAGSAGFQEDEAGAKEDFAEQVGSTGEHSGAANGGPSAEEADEEAADDKDKEEPLEEPRLRGGGSVSSSGLAPASQCGEPLRPRRSPPRRQPARPHRGKGPRRSPCVI